MPSSAMQMQSTNCGEGDKNTVSRTLRHPNQSDDAVAHNFGQPMRPPHHSSTSAINDCKSGASKQHTDCRVEQRASLACIEENYQNKDQACVKYFEAYKRCRREEHERKLEANARSSAW